jgi:hypothetical protein
VVTGRYRAAPSQAVRGALPPLFNQILPGCLPLLPPLALSDRSTAAIGHSVAGLSPRP